MKFKHLSDTQSYAAQRYNDSNVRFFNVGRMYDIGNAKLKNWFV